LGFFFQAGYFLIYLLLTLHRNVLALSKENNVCTSDPSCAIENTTIGDVYNTWEMSKLYEIMLLFSACSKVNTSRIFVINSDRQPLCFLSCLLGFLLYCFLQRIALLLVTAGQKHTKRINKLSLLESLGKDLCPSWDNGSKTQRVRQGGTGAQQIKPRED